MKRNNPSPSVLRPFITFFLCLFVAGFAVRNKQIATLPELKELKAEVSLENKEQAVVFYLHEKQITVTAKNESTAGRKIILLDGKSKVPRKPEKNDKTKILTSPEPGLADEPADDDPQEFVGTYVAAPKIIEFTIIDPVKPVVPDIVCETPHPYIQKSSFYFTDVDTTAGKKVIIL